MAMQILQKTKKKIFSYCFSSAFRKKQRDVIIPYENNGVLSSPLLSEEDIKQHLIRTKVFTWVGLKNLHSESPRIGGGFFFPVLIIMGYQVYAIVVEHC